MIKGTPFQVAFLRIGAKKACSAIGSRSASLTTVPRHRGTDPSRSSSFVRRTLYSTGTSSLIAWFHCSVLATVTTAEPRASTGRNHERTRAERGGAADTPREVGKGKQRR